MADNLNKTDEQAFAAAAEKLLSSGYNNFDLIKIMRISANKVRDARRAARTAKPEAKPAPAAAPKPVAAPKPAVAQK